MLRRSLLVSVLFVCGLAVASTAGAHKITYVTKVSITAAYPTGASGSLSCATHPCPAACHKKRLVYLMQIRHGPDQVMGTGRTTANGSWTIPALMVRGSYYAIGVGRKLPAGPTHRHICGFGLSRIRRF